MGETCVLEGRQGRCSGEVRLRCRDGHGPGEGEDEAGCNRGICVLEREALPSAHIEARPGLCPLQALHGGPSPELGLELAGGGRAGADRPLFPQPPPPADVAEPEHLGGAAAPVPRVPAPAAGQAVLGAGERGGTGPGRRGGKGKGKSGRIGEQESLEQRREPKSPWNPSVSQEEEEAEKELFIEDSSPTVSVLVLSPRCWPVSPLCYLYHPRKCLPTEFCDALDRFSSFYNQSEEIGTGSWRLG